MANGILWLKLDETSREKLLKACPPQYEQVFCDHVTLRYDVAQTEVAAYIGQRYSVKAYEHCMNSATQAVRVATGDLPDQYGVPHITISTKTDIPPVSSVKMLQDSDCVATALPPLTLAGVIEFVPLAA